MKVNFSAVQLRPAAVVQRLIVRASAVAPGLKPRLETAMIRALYSTVSLILKSEDPAFLNYGYAPIDPDVIGLKLDPVDEADRIAIELYSRVAGGWDLQGKDVLEVGCGRGGGASFIARYLHPASVTAVDLSARAVRYCRRRHRIEHLAFLRGEAEHLRFPSRSFDAVVNVESSHTYPSFEGFIEEVARVLRPGGVFLFADFRLRHQIAHLREQINKRFTVIKEEFITDAVVRALELDSDRRSLVIQKRAPRFLNKALHAFAAVNGSPTFEAFRSGELQYIRYVLQLPKE